MIKENVQILGVIVEKNGSKNTLVCFGASVTAQKFETGYFQQLEHTSCAKLFDSVEKIAFGGSHLNMAGYAFLEDVLSLRPKVCILDWHSTSLKSFDEVKLICIISNLAKNGCVPLWVFLPRVDTYFNYPESYFQTKKLGIPFFDLVPHLDKFELDPSIYLRDIVHTNQNGAIVYANLISEAVAAIIKNHSAELEKIRTSFSKSPEYTPPSVVHFSEIIDRKSPVRYEFHHVGGLFEVFAECQLGPSLCYIKVTILDGSIELMSKVVNLADQWCYYTRLMVVQLVKFNLISGSYTLLVEYNAGNPLEDVLLKSESDLDIDESDRYLNIKRLAIASCKTNC